MNFIIFRPLQYDFVSQEMKFAEQFGYNFLDWHDISNLEEMLDKILK